MSRFDAKRASHAYTQHLDAEPGDVFPLLCPVREREWARGWVCEMVYSVTGLAEAGCVFTTPPDTEGDPEAVWMVTRYDPVNFAIEFAKVTPNRTTAAIEIHLTPAGDEATAAHIRYTLTALSPAGHEAVERFTEAYCVGFMQAWEKELNHFLKSGEMLDE